MSKKYVLTHNLYKTIGLILTMVVCVFFVLAGVFWGTNKDGDSGSNTSTLAQSPILNQNGWNKDELYDLTMQIDAIGDDIALCNNRMATNKIRLGNVDWMVTFRHGNIVTILALQSVGEASNATQAQEYLENVFYPNLLATVGYDKLDSSIIQSGDIDVLYQRDGMQNIPLLAENR